MANESIYSLNYIKYLFILTTIILIPIIFEFALRNKNVFDKTYLYVVISVFIPLLLILAYQYFGAGKAFDSTSLSNYLILSCDIKSYHLILHSNYLVQVDNLLYASVY